jgi:hypothetical protein
MLFHGVISYASMLRHAYIATPVINLSVLYVITLTVSQPSICEF